MDTTKSGKSFLDFLTRNSKKIIIGLVVLAGLVLLSFGVYAFVFRDTAATVDGKKISTAEYAKINDQCKKTTETNGAVGELEKCKTSSLDQLILLKALETDATKHSINISDAEVDEKYQSLIKNYSTEEIMLATYKVRFNESAEDIKQSFRLDLLKEKLGPILLNSKSVMAAFARWDILDPSISESDAKLTTTTLVDKYYTIAIKGSQTQSELNLIAAKVRAENQTWNDSAQAYTGIFEKSGLNEGNGTVVFEGSQDWSEIAKLQSVGDATGVVVSDGGYVAVYRLTDVKIGSYDSWDKYMEGAKKRANVYSFTYNTYSAKTAFITDTISFTNKIASTLGVQKLFAACSTSHFAEFVVYGVHAAGNMSASVTNLHVQYNKGTVGSCPSCGTEYCSGSFDSATSAFKIGQIRDPNKKWLSCFAMWDVTISNPSYYPVGWTNRSTDVNGSSTYLDKQISGHVAKAYYYAADPNTSGPTWVSSTSGHENINNDGFIQMVPAVVQNPKCTITVNKSAIKLGESVNITWADTSADYGSTYKVVNGESLLISGMYFANFTTSDSPTASTSYYRQVLSGSSPWSVCGPATVEVTNKAVLDVSVTGNDAARGLVGSGNFTIPVLDPVTGITTNVNTAINVGGVNPQVSSLTLPLNTSVTLTATVPSGDQLTWTGCNSFTGNVCSVTMTDYKNVVATFTYTQTLTKSLTCNVNPDTGLAPLVVRVNATPGNLISPTFTYYMGDAPETVLSNKPATLYFTYSLAGSYQIYVTNPDYRSGERVSCSVGPVKVSNPTNNSGGEVSP